MRNTTHQNQSLFLLKPTNLIMIKDDGTVSKTLKCTLCGHTWVLKFPKFTAIDIWKKCPACGHFSNIQISDTEKDNFFTQNNNKK